MSHNTPDESDESAGEAAQMLRRLKAMTLMQLEGWTPQVEFWEEPGTLMDGLQLIRRVTVGGSRRLAHALLCVQVGAQVVHRYECCRMHVVCWPITGQKHLAFTCRGVMHMMVDAGVHSHVHHRMCEPAPLCVPYRGAARVQPHTHQLCQPESL